MHEYTVEFRVEGAKVELAIITAEMGLEPSQVREIGSQGKDMDSCKNEATERSG